LKRAAPIPESAVEEAIERVVCTAAFNKPLKTREDVREMVRAAFSVLASAS